jgi:hypothetical protein
MYVQTQPELIDSFKLAMDLYSPCTHSQLVQAAKEPALMAACKWQTNKLFAALNSLHSASRVLKQSVTMGEYRPNEFLDKFAPKGPLTTSVSRCDAMEGAARVSVEKEVFVLHYSAPLLTFQAACMADKVSKELIWGDNPEDTGCKECWQMQPTFWSNREALKSVFVEKVKFVIKDLENAWECSSRAQAKRSRRTEEPPPSMATCLYTCVTKECYESIARQPGQPCVLKTNMFRSLQGLSSSAVGSSYVPLFPDELSAATLCSFHSFTANAAAGAQHSPTQWCTKSDRSSVPQLVLLTIWFKDEHWLRLLNSPTVTPMPQKKKKSMFPHWQCHNEGLEDFVFKIAPSTVQLDVETTQADYPLMSVFADVAAAGWARGLQ